MADHTEAQRATFRAPCGTTEEDKLDSYVNSGRGLGAEYGRKKHGKHTGKQRRVRVGHRMVTVQP